MKKKKFVKFAKFVKIMMILCLMILLASTAHVERLNVEAENTPAPLMLTSCAAQKSYIQLSWGKSNFPAGKYMYSIYCKDVTKGGFVKEGAEKNLCKSKYFAGSSSKQTFNIKKVRVGKKKVSVKKAKKRLFEIVVTTTTEGRRVYSKPSLVATNNLTKKRYSNAVSISGVPKIIDTLYVGVEGKITDFNAGKFKVVYANKKGKAPKNLSTLRYISSNPYVVSVTKTASGKIELQGISPGIANVFTYTTNGFWKATTIKVVNKDISYMPNPGDKELIVKGQMDSTDITSEVTKVSECGFVCPGYKFKEWNTLPNPDFTADEGTPERGTVYEENYELNSNPKTDAAGNPIDEKAEKITLYAQWEPDEVGTKLEVRYYVPSVVNPNKSEIKTYYTRAVVESIINFGKAEGEDTLVDEIKENRFDGTDFDYAEISEYQVQQEDNIVNIYCKRNSYELKYDLGTNVEMENTPEPKMYQYGEKVEITDKIPVKTDLTDKKRIFLGWAARYEFSGVSKALDLVSDSSLEMPAGPTVITPIWGSDQDEYLVTLHDYFPTGGDKIQLVLCNQQMTAEQLKEPEIEGYTFGGWYKDADFSENWNKDLDIVTSTTDIYAKWTKNSYTVSYVLGDRETYDVPEPKTISYGDTVYLTDEIPTKTGKDSKFLGWEVKSGDDTIGVLSNNSFTMPDGAVTVKALWGNQEDCLVTLRDYYPTGGDMSFTVEHSSTLTNAQLEAPTITGYTFGGWFEESDFGTAWDMSKKVTESLDLYAKWEKNKNAVKYVLNSAEEETCEGLEDMPSVEFGQSVVLSDKTPKKPGRKSKFVGWEASYKKTGESAATSIGIDSDNTFLMPDGEVMVKPVWTDQDDCLVTLRDYYPTGGEKSYQVHYSDKLTAEQLTPPTVTGWTHKGWFVDENYGTEWAIATDEVKKSTDIYAKWEKNKYDVVYSLGSATCEGLVTTESNISYGDTVTVTSLIPKTTGRTSKFLGWKASYEVSGSSPKTIGIESDNTFKMPDGKVTIEPVWGNQDDCLVSLRQYYPNGGDMTYVVEHSSALTTEQLTPPTVTGYTHKGWFKKGNYEESSKWADSDIVTERLDLFAKWEINTHSVSYDTDGGSSFESYNQSSVEFGDTVAVPVDVPTKTGKNSKFVRWVATYTDSNGNTKTVAIASDNEFEMPDGDVTLKAEWTDQDDCVVIFHNVRYFGGDKIFTVEYGSSITNIPTPYDDGTGKTFEGWYTDGSYSASWTPSEPIIKDMDIYAKWSE